MKLSVVLVVAIIFWSAGVVTRTSCCQPASQKRSGGARIDGDGERAEPRNLLNQLAGRLLMVTGPANALRPLWNYLRSEQDRQISDQSTCPGSIPTVTSTTTSTQTSTQTTTSLATSAATVTSVYSLVLTTTLTSVATETLTDSTNVNK